MPGTGQGAVIKHLGSCLGSERKLTQLQNRSIPYVYGRLTVWNSFLSLYADRELDGVRSP